MAAIAVSTLGLLACDSNNDRTASSKINLTGTYNGTGSDSSGGFSWDITGSSATINCPAGTYIPTAIKNSPPIGQALIIHIMEVPLSLVRIYY